jgi:hypothetical protein
VIRRAYRILVVIFEGLLGRPRRRGEDAIKMDFIEPCWEDDCIRLAEIMNSFNDHDVETSYP